MVLRAGPSGPIEAVTVANIVPGPPGTELHTNALGIVVWEPELPIPPALVLPGAVNEVLTTIGGVSIWQLPAPVAFSGIIPGAGGEYLMTDPTTGLTRWGPPPKRRDLSYGVAGAFAVNLAAFTAIGSFSLNPADLPDSSGGLMRTFVFEAIVWATLGMTAEVRLWNLTDGAVVAGTVLNTALLNPTRLVSAALAVPAVLPNALRLYEVQLRISAGLPGQGTNSFCSMARLITSWS